MTGMALDVVIPTLGQSPILEALTLWVDNQQGVVAKVLAGAPGTTPAGWLSTPSNPGFGAACNAGATAGSAPFIAFLNDDLAPRQGTLLSLATALEASPWAFAVVPSVFTRQDGNEIDEAATRLVRRRGRPWVSHRPGQVPGLAAFPTGAAFVCRRSAWASLGGFDEGFGPAYWEDVDLGLRAWAEGWATWRVPGVAFDHLRGETTGAWPKPVLEGRYHRGQRLVAKRHRRVLGLQPWWWGWEALSQARDLATGKWQRLRARWGW